MLTIREKLPIKKMALYGSTAILVGFAGTYTLLREVFPYASRDNLADITREGKQTASGSVIKPVAEISDGKTTDAPKDALKESGMAVSEPSRATQQPPNEQAPVIPPSNNDPVTAAPIVTPVPTIVEPADTTPQPAPQPLLNPLPAAEAPTKLVAPLLENTTDSVTNVQVKQ